MRRIKARKPAETVAIYAEPEPLSLRAQNLLDEELLTIAARAAAHEQVMGTRHDGLSVEAWLEPLGDLATYRRLIRRP